MEYVASLSYGKDSMAMLHVIKDVLDLPLDRIITADIWATDTIPADLPPMVEFKAYADKEIKRRWGIEVEHFCAVKPDGTKRTFEGQYHTIVTNSRTTHNGHMYGFPLLTGSWCVGYLKTGVLKLHGGDIAHYVGIAADEPVRVKRHRDGGKMLPLVDAGWTEPMCRDWCEENGLLSPIYKTGTRGGVGSAQSNAWTVTDNCGRCTRTCGRSCSSGKGTCQTERYRRTSPWKTSSGVSNGRTRDTPRRAKRSNGQTWTTAK